VKSSSARAWGKSCPLRQIAPKEGRKIRVSLLTEFCHPRVERVVVAESKEAAKAILDDEEFTQRLAPHTGEGAGGPAIRSVRRDTPHDTRTTGSAQTDETNAEVRLVDDPERQARRDAYFAAHARY